MREVSYNLCEQITEGFSAERKVGEGGYAQVHYGSGYLANTDSSQDLPAHLVVKVDKFAYHGMRELGRDARTRTRKSSRSS